MDTTATKCEGCGEQGVNGLGWACFQAKIDRLAERYEADVRAGAVAS